MNILFIMTDALRPDRLGCYGYRKNTSPHIDQLAAEGVKFENFIATASHTLPPVVSYLTGCDTATHGIVNQESFAVWQESGYYRKPKTPLTLMKRSGYEVDGELVMRWGPLGFCKDTPTAEIENYFRDNAACNWFFFAEPYSTHLPYNPPEDYYQMFLGNGIVSKETDERMKIVKSRLIVHPSGCMSKLQAGEKDALPDDETDASHKRTFGIVDLMSEDKAAVDALYDGEVKVFDNLVGRYVNTLEELGILDKTLIIIASDHGEELLERGHVGHCSCNLNGTLYDESIKVPLIIRCPALLPKGRVIKQQASQIDLMPTLFDLLGLKMPGPCDGRSLLPLIRRTTEVFRKDAYCEATPAGWQALSGDQRNMWALRTNEYKLILKTDHNFSFKNYELYDLRNDPGEKSNIFNVGDRDQQTLCSMLHQYIKRALLNRQRAELVKCETV
jgi:arylsulfatase A-like enzyme